MNAFPASLQQILLSTVLSGADFDAPDENGATPRLLVGDTPSGHALCYCTSIPCMCRIAVAANQRPPDVRDPTVCLCLCLRAGVGGCAISPVLAHCDNGEAFSQVKFCDHFFYAAANSAGAFTSASAAAVSSSSLARSSLSPTGTSGMLAVSSAASVVALSV
jgi:hypothetical protein